MTQISHLQPIPKLQTSLNWTAVGRTGFDCSWILPIFDRNRQKFGSGLLRWGETPGEPLRRWFLGLFGSRGRSPHRVEGQSSPLTVFTRSGIKRQPVKPSPSQVRLKAGDAVELWQRERRMEACFQLPLCHLNKWRRGPGSGGAHCENPTTGSRNDRPSHPLSPRSAAGREGRSARRLRPTWQNLGARFVPPTLNHTRHCAHVVKSVALISFLMQ